MASILVRMFEHNHWANLRAVEACADLTDGQLDATVVGTGGPIRDTLMHIAGAEQRYVMRLSGRRPNYGERDGWPTIARLRQEFDATRTRCCAASTRDNPTRRRRRSSISRPSTTRPSIAPRSRRS